jgi:hypothetical protein
MNSLGDTVIDRSVQGFNLIRDLFPGSKRGMGLRTTPYLQSAEIKSELKFAIAARSFCIATLHAKI